MNERLELRRTVTRLARRTQWFAGCLALLSATTTCYPSSQRDPVLEHWSTHFDRIAPSTAPQPTTSPIDHVVVVAVDGVRWQEVFRGTDPKLAGSASPYRRWIGQPEALLPNIHRIANQRGILLGNDESRVFVSSPSTVSLPGYSELFSGRTPRCSNNDCPPTDEPTLLDDWHRAQPQATLAMMSSWERIPRMAARDGRALAISSGRSTTQGLTEALGNPRLRSLLSAAAKAGPSPGIDDYRPDRFTAEIALEYLEDVRPRFLFLGLGDTDEHAHHGDYDAYLAALQYADSAVGRADQWLRQRQLAGERTLLVVTTDHGRCASFRHHGGTAEAARIWSLWSGDLVGARGTPAIGDSRLADVAATLRRVLGLPADESPTAGRELIARVTEPATVQSQLARR